MVAPTAKWKVKWRTHCATCGKPFDRPDRWAYCSKPCELARRGFVSRAQERRGELGREVGAAREYLRLAALLEDAPMHEREAIRQRMVQHVQPEIVEGPQAAVPTVTIVGGAKIAPVATDTLEFWVPVVGAEWDQFEGTLRKSLLAAIKLGRRLCEARAALPHGEFERLFQDHATPVAGAMRFTSRWAQQLMSIADNDTLAKAKHVSLLPADLNSVYQLSRVPAETLEQAIASGTVRPQMRREDVRKFVGEVRGAPVESRPEPTPIDECLRVVRRAIAAFATRHPEQLGELTERTNAILRDLIARRAS